MPNKVGRPRGRKDNKPRGAFKKLDSEVKAQRDAESRERLTTMSETKLQSIARQMQGGATDGTVILTAKQWQSELRNGVLE